MRGDRIAAGRLGEAKRLFRRSALIWREMGNRRGSFGLPVRSGADHDHLGQERAGRLRDPPSTRTAVPAAEPASSGSSARLLARALDRSVPALGDTPERMIGSRPRPRRREYRMARSWESGRIGVGDAHGRGGGRELRAPERGPREPPRIGAAMRDHCFSVMLAFAALSGGCGSSSQAPPAESASRDGVTGASGGEPTPVACAATTRETSGRPCVDDGRFSGTVAAREGGQWVLAVTAPLPYPSQSR